MSKTIDIMDILKYFFNEPNREFHLREISKISKISPTTTSNYLNRLSKEGLIGKRTERNLVLYRANIENAIFREIKRHYNIIYIIKSELVEHINEELNFPEAIILFGSFAKAENIKGESDVDLFILSESKKQLDLKKYEKYLNAEIQTFVKTKKEFEIMKKKNKDLINNIINGIRLSGFLEVFK